MGVYPQAILGRTAATVDAFQASFKERLNAATSNPEAPARFFPNAPAANNK